MNVLRVWSKLKLEFSPDCLKYGWLGPGDCIKQLTIQDTKIISTNLLSTSDTNDMILAALAIENDEYEVDNLIRGLSATITVQTKVKWHITLLVKFIVESKSLQDCYISKSDYIYTYWFFSGFFDEIPFDKSPSFYGTQYKYNQLIRLNHIYLQKKLAELRE